MEVTKHRSIFISDVHIGIRASKVKELLHFLKYNDCEHLYLLGDTLNISLQIKQFLIVIASMKN